jgi:CheY-like chemotaxis protein
MTVEATAPSSNPLVLLADDKPAIRRLLTEVLDAAGFRTLATADGTGILELAARFKPAVILLDIIMPNVDGYATAARLKGHPELHHIPIVFVTAQEAPVHRTVGFGLGATAHLIKPFTARQLTEIVRHAIDRGSVLAGWRPVAAGPCRARRSCGRFRATWFRYQRLGAAPSSPGSPRWRSACRGGCARRLPGGSPGSASTRRPPG